MADYSEYSTDVTEYLNNGIKYKYSMDVTKYLNNGIKYKYSTRM